MKKKLRSQLSKNVKKRLHKKAWALMSEWKRRSEHGKCFTCGEWKFWRFQDAGHYIHKNCLDYEDMNIHCQCSRCNRFLHGNLGVYAERMIALYGLESVEALRLKSEQVKKFTITELEEIICCLRIKLAELS